MLKPRRFHQAKSASAETREPQRHRSPRIVAIDNLKSLLVAWIIANHAVVGYTAIGGWPYDEVNETTLPPPVEYVLTLVLGPTALFVIGTFFFLAGLFAPVELSHHGRSHFVKTRIVRLGLPWLIFMLLIWPFFMWLAYRSAGYDLTFWQVFRGRQPFLDSGPLWFVQILMYVSIGYALWNWLGRRRRWHRRHLVRRPAVGTGAQSADSRLACVAIAAMRRNVLSGCAAEPTWLGEAGAQQHRPPMRHYRRCHAGGG